MEPTDDEIKIFLGNKLRELEPAIAAHYQSNLVFGKCFGECIICEAGENHIK